MRGSVVVFAEEGGPEVGDLLLGVVRPARADVVRRAAAAASGGLIRLTFALALGLFFVVVVD